MVFYESFQFYCWKCVKIWICYINHTFSSLLFAPVMWELNVWFGTRAMNCMHLCLWKTLSQDCPHGEVAFSTSMCIYNVKTYNNLLLKAKGRKKLVKLQYVIIYYGEMMPLISFHHNRQIYYGEMIHYDFISP